MTQPPTRNFDHTLLTEQLSYYRARAGEYDEWFFRQGRYDRGLEANERWFSEVAEVEATLDDFAPAGSVLELACGTGLWTRHLVRHASKVTAVDGSPEMLSINGARLRDAGVRYVEADLFSWRPTERFDVVFFAFWLSHVPPERFDSFWSLVEGSLRDGGRVFFVDGLYEETSTARDHQLQGAERTSMLRRLNDGSEYRVVKVFHQPQELSSRLRALGWAIDVRTTGRYFLYGAGGRKDAR